MVTQISIDLISMDEGDQTIGIRIDPVGEALPASLILKGQFDLCGKDKRHLFDFSELDMILGAVQEVLATAIQYPRLKPTVPEDLLDFNLRDHRYAVISMG